MVLEMNDRVNSLRNSKVDYTVTELEKKISCLFFARDKKIEQRSRVGEVKSGLNR